MNWDSDFWNLDLEFSKNVIVQLDDGKVNLEFHETDNYADAGMVKFDFISPFLVCHQLN